MIPQTFIGCCEPIFTGGNKEEIPKTVLNLLIILCPVMKDFFTSTKGVIYSIITHSFIYSKQSIFLPLSYDLLVFHTDVTPYQPERGSAVTHHIEDEK